MTAAAESDLESIGDYIALDDPCRATLFVKELVRRCETLAVMPRRYPLVPRYETAGIRRLPFHDYLVFYRIGADRIDVLRVLNASRDYERILFSV